MIFVSPDKSSDQFYRPLISRDPEQFLLRDLPFIQVKMDEELGKRRFCQRGKAEIAGNDIKIFRQKRDLFFPHAEIAAGDRIPVKTPEWCAQIILDPRINTFGIKAAIYFQRTSRIRFFLISHGVSLVLNIHKKFFSSAVILRS